MAAKNSRRRKSQNRSIELLEDRRVMAAGTVGSMVPLGEPFVSNMPMIEHHGGFAEDPPQLVHHADPDADFWIESGGERDVEALLGDIEQTLASAHGLSGLTQVRNNYGFLGAGQTVAIIDSGIAFDHWALGNGYGANFRVVGGWDFAENDANPYDDGPEGSHGTHVAGIVGADRTGTADDGVAPGVDLVGLRVFDDAGNGYFDWVEYALQWVHQNRNAHEFPITAVNLSIGTTWNDTSVPSWSTLEDEFAQLKADGIFVSVSAGNSYANYNTPGLSYPAASPNVVPVMSVDDNGSLSHFSQRHPSALAAPGRFIVSTVPDYAGNHNGVTDDFASFSGTSMAAPYVAGASVILREAMQFLGYANITQTTLFNHLMTTADTFFDSATGLNYKRLNLNSAINALMPTDDYGSTTATAYNLGTLSGSSEISGLIGSLSDADYFRFTAAGNGTATFTATTSHGLMPVWTGSGGVVSGPQGNTFTFQVTAGQSYTFGLSTSGGIGYYDLAIESPTASVLPPTVPGSFQVTVLSPTEIRLNWSDSTGEDSYQIIGWTSGTLSYTAGNAAANSTSYTLTGLTPNSRYFFRVQAVNSAGTVSTAFALAQTPALPIGVPGSFQVAVISSTQVDLDWDAAAGATFYKVLHWSSPTGTTVVTTLNANVTNYTMSNLSPGTRHWFQIQAGNSSNMASTEFKLGETPATVSVPGSFQVVVNSPTEVALDWNASPGATFYRVYHWTPQTLSYVMATLNANVTNYTATGLTPDTRHWFRVEAGNSGSVASTPFVLGQTPAPMGMSATVGGLADQTNGFSTAFHRSIHHGPTSTETLSKGRSGDLRIASEWRNDSRPSFVNVPAAGRALPRGAASQDRRELSAYAEEDVKNDVDAIYEAGILAGLMPTANSGLSDDLLRLLAESSPTTIELEESSNHAISMWQGW